MTDETALKLAEALNRFSTALERLNGNSLGGGISVYHHGLNDWQRHQPQSWCSQAPAVEMPRYY